MKSSMRVRDFENTVKVLDSLSERTNNLFHGSLKENIFFLHIHKCGGSSITEAIKSCYRTLDIIKDRYQVHLDSEAAFNATLQGTGQTNSHSDATDYLLLKFRENLLLYYMCQKHINYIGGHFSFSETAYQNFSNKYAFVTVLRDPVKRWISAYFFNRYKVGEQRRIHKEIIEYLKSERGQMGGYGYVKLLGGPDEGQDYTSEQAINRAKENLHKFRVVGCLEYMDNFLNQFEEQFGKRLKIKVLNQSPKPEAHRKSVISEEIEEEIRQICRPNIEVYQHALDNFVKVKH